MNNQKKLIVYQVAYRYTAEAPYERAFFTERFEAERFEEFLRDNTTIKDSDIICNSSLTWKITV